ncbi:MAG TPA: methyl-accepting chemotaxis protein [Terriglobales bacterium]|nr:methyl-accepting chemotaxis protein [Terriglobales bacterium]
MRNQGIARRMILVVAASVAITVAAVLGLSYLLRVSSASAQSVATAARTQTQRSFELLDLAVKVQGTTQKLVQTSDPDVMESLIQQNGSLVKDGEAKVERGGAGGGEVKAAYLVLVQANQQVIDLVLQARNAESHQAIIEKSNPAFEALLRAINSDENEVAKKLSEDAAVARVHSVRLEFTIFASVVFGVLLLIVWGLALVRSVSKALNSMIRMVEDLAEGEGDLTKRLEIFSHDELGELAKWFNTFLDQIYHIISQVAGTADQVASASEALNTTSQQITANSEETSAQAEIVSKAAQAVSQNLQTVATGAEEMEGSIKEIAKNATEAARAATSAVKVAKSTTATVSKLGESSNEIGQVIKVITSIAQQTNLLALNATIEAARAGEAGKGFAVVANEVKELAKETARATEDISHKIEAIQTDTKAAVDAIASMSGVINQVNDISGTIATAVEEQNATTNEMSRNVSEAAQGSGEITSNIARVAEAAQSTTHGATDTQKAAQQLVEMSTQLRNLVGQFKIGDRSDAGTAAAANPSVETRAAAASG